ncbi:MAG: ATP-binding protein, partial [Clostridium sp.]
IKYISRLWYSLKYIRNTKIIFDMTNTKTLSVNICSSLGLILEKVKLKNNEIYFRKVPDDIKSTLIKNEFLKSIQNKDSYLNKGDFLAYRKFSVKEKSEFEEYLVDNISAFVEKNLLSCDIKDVTRAISEMFANVKMHTLSKEIVTAGYYEKKNKAMYFTISNHGVTIAKNIEKMNGYFFDKEVEAIEWAIKKSSSTRHSTETGGLGLYTTRNFVKEIKGSMWIVSGRAYWYESIKGIERAEMNSAFPGTIITFMLPLNYDRNISEDLSESIISISDIIGGELW